MSKEQTRPALLNPLLALLIGADDVLDNFSADGIDDDLSKAMAGLREDVELARSEIERLHPTPTDQRP